MYSHKQNVHITLYTSRNSPEQLYIILNLLYDFSLAKVFLINEMGVN